MQESSMNYKYYKHKNVYVWHFLFSPVVTPLSFYAKKMSSGSLLLNIQYTSLFVKIGIVFKGQHDCLNHLSQVLIKLQILLW